MALSSLISADDRWDLLVRAVASLLAVDTATQVALATAEGAVDPTWWNLKVYQEREEAIADALDGDLIPVVSVSLGGVQGVQRTTAGSARMEATITVDCFGFGQTDPTTPLASFDAARRARRAATLVRNILEATENRHLGMPASVPDHHVQSIDFFADNESPTGAISVAVARVTFKAMVLQPNIDRDLETLEILTLACYREEDGLVYMQEEFTNAD